MPGPNHIFISEEDANRLLDVLRQQLTTWVEMLGTPPVHHWLHVPYDKHPELVYPVSLVAACSRETSTVFCAKSLPTEIDGIPTNYACCLGYLDVSAPYRKVGFGLLVRSETGWDLPGALRVARQRQDYGARSHGDQRS